MSKFTRQGRVPLLTAAAVIAAVCLSDGAEPAEASGSGTLTDDRDGKTYKTARMPDGRIWMAENLNYPAQSGKSWCYMDDKYYCGKYGRLYDWKTARTVCPSGWRLPFHWEWDSLGQAAGGYRQELYGRTVWYNVGEKLKAERGWRHGNGTDEYGFSALPGGSRLGSNGSFGFAGSNGCWWAVMGNGGGYVYYISNHGGEGSGDMYVSRSDKGDGFSVRCVREGAAPPTR